MSRYHDRTLKLLGPEGAVAEQSTAGLIERARMAGIALPAAYLEWAQLDGERLLRKYSNDDWFGFGAPEIAATPEGIRGITFHSENQGNFDLIAALDRGDDPPVFFAWLGKPPWITYCQRFSDCVYAQIFDWQYLLEFDPANPDSKEIAWCGEVRLRTARGADILRQRFEEAPTTRFEIEGGSTTIFRFLKSPKERMTAIAQSDGTMDIQITGERDLAARLEAELLEIFSGEVIPTRQPP